MNNIYDNDLVFRIPYIQLWQRLFYFLKSYLLCDKLKLAISMQQRKTFNFSNDFSIGLNSQNMDNPFQQINLREQSMSSFQRYIPEDSRGLNIFNFDNTIGFSEIVSKRPKPEFKEEEEFAQGPEIQSESKLMQQPEFEQQLVNEDKTIDRTSLKYFAKNLLKIMRESKQWFNLKQVSMLLASALSSKELRAEYKENELKNIKRRCYDAINVMLAANVLERDGQKVRYREIIKDEDGNENSVYVSQAEAIRRDIQAKLQVLKIKRMAYQMSKEKKQAIAEWIQTKRGMKDSQVLSQKLLFPVMFLLSNKTNGAAQLKQRRKQSICLEGNRLMLMGELDLLAEHRRMMREPSQSVKKQQQGEGDYYFLNRQE